LYGLQILVDFTRCFCYYCFDTKGIYMCVISVLSKYKIVPSQAFRTSTKSQPLIEVLLYEYPLIGGYAYANFGTHF